MRLGVAINVYNKVQDLKRNIELWKSFKTETVISVFNNGPFQLNFNGSDIYNEKMQYRDKRIETPLTLGEAVKPLLSHDLDFIIWSHADYFYLNEMKLFTILRAIKEGGLEGCVHKNCDWCRGTSEFTGIVKTMGEDAIAASAYCLILRPDFIRRYDLSNLEPFEGEGCKPGGTAETFTYNLYKKVGNGWSDLIMDLPRHGPDCNEQQHPSYFPDIGMIHSHLNLGIYSLQNLFEEVNCAM